MQALEYLNENSLRKYPFVDGAPLISTSGVSLPTGLFLDAGLYPTVSDVRIRLIRIEKIVTNISIVLEWVSPDTSTGIYPTVSIAVSSVTPLLATTFSVTGLSGFFIFGTALSALPNNIYYYTGGENYVCDSRVLPLAPRVSGVVLSNYDLGGSVDVVGSTTTTLDVEEGSNTQFIPTTSGVQVGVVAGVGTGPYDACGGASVVRTINTLPTTNGSFIFASDACQRLTTPEPHTLYIENICTAGCSSDAIAASAYYINRVNDGLAQLGNVISEFRDDLNTQIEEYVDVTIPQRETPYTINTIARYGGGKPSTGTHKNYTYFTMRTYVYNPSTENITVTAAATIGVTAQLVSMLYQDKNGGTVAVSIPSLPPVFCAGSTAPCRSFTVPCKTFVVVKLTARVLNPAAGKTNSSLTINTTVGSHTYAVETGL